MGVCVQGAVIDADTARDRKRDRKSLGAIHKERMGEEKGRRERRQEGKKDKEKLRDEKRGEAESPTTTEAGTVFTMSRSQSAPLKN